MNPVAHGRGDELKRQLVHAAIAAIEAISDVAPRAHIVQADPVINIVPDPARPEAHEAAEGHRLALYHSWAMLAGRLCPKFGGDMRSLDILGEVEGKDRTPALAEAHDEDQYPALH
jgi:polysaccharide biosynthesis protein PelF